MKKLLLILLFFSSAIYADLAKRITIIVVNNEAFLSKQGEQSLIGRYINTVNASGLIQEFQENELAYTRAYVGKPVRIKTIVSGVKLNISNKPYILANGKNQFEFISMFVKNENEVIKLKKGDKVDMVCTGSKTNVMYPFFERCVTSEKYFDELTKSTEKRINNYSLGNPKYYVDYMTELFSDFIFNNPEYFNDKMTNTEILDFLMKTLSDSDNDLDIKISKSASTIKEKYNLDTSSLPFAEFPK